MLRVSTWDAKYEAERDMEATEVTFLVNSRGQSVCWQPVSWCHAVICCWAGPRGGRLSNQQGADRKLLDNPLLMLEETEPDDFSYFLL